MRWIKLSIVSVFGIILVVTAALAIAGSGSDANRLQCSVVIRQKPAAIWPWLYEAEKVKQWVTWVVEVRNQGAPTPGSKMVWVMEDRNNGNARMEIAAVAEAVEPERKLSMALSAADAFRGTSTYTLTEQPDGSTVLGSDSRYTFANRFARFMTPLVIWQAKKKMISDMFHLRTLVEDKP
jgi:uncharacterized protein YndB with AHSA1/START domain